MSCPSAANALELGLIWEFLPVVGADYTNWVSGDPFTGGFGWAAPTYPDTDLAVRQTFGIKVNNATGPSGENTVAINYTNPSDGRGAFMYFTPVTTGTTIVSGFPTVQWGGWNAQGAKLTFDLKIDSTWVNLLVSNGWTPAVTGIFGQLCAIIAQSGNIELEYSFDPALGGGVGVSGSNIVMRWSLLRYLVGAGATTTFTTSTVPMDEWLSFTVAWVCGTTPDGVSIASDGALYVAYQPKVGGTITTLYNHTCYPLYLNRTLTIDPSQDAGIAAPWPAPDYNYATAVEIADGLTTGNMLGEWANIKLTAIELTESPPPPVTPPTQQRAPYVFFSREITERQVETRWTRMFLQMLVADAPPVPPPLGVISLVTITGTITDQNGNMVTSGRLHIKPRNFINVGGQYLISKTETTYDVTGPLDLQLAPSGGIIYDVEFDPTPEDEDTPRNLKAGFWKDKWLIPDVGPVDIADL